jgi:hypothetical protein
MILTGGLLGIVSMFLIWSGSSWYASDGWWFIRHMGEFASMDHYGWWMPSIVLMTSVSVAINGLVGMLRPVKGGGVTAIVCGIIMIAATYGFMRYFEGGHGLFDDIGPGVWVTIAAGVLLIIFGTVKTFKY